MIAPVTWWLGWHTRLLVPAMRLATLGERLYGIPRSSETMMLMVNTGVLRDLGRRPPATAAELESLAAEALRRGLLAGGTAAMAPGMTGMIPGAGAPVDAVPFPPLRDDVPAPVYVFGTASLIGVNAASRVPDEAAAVLDHLFTSDVRRRFSAHVPGDWNIPLADPDADALTRLAPPFFARPAVGLTEAVAHGRFGYADWSYLPPETERLVTAHVRPLAEGTLKPAEHLAQLQAAFARETPSPGL